MTSNTVPGSSPDRQARRVVALTLLVAVLVWLGLSLPLLSGVETLYFRDVFHSHFPFKAFGAEQLRQGRLPAFNPSWALGQPFRGNPNTVSFYPGNIAYLLLPFWIAFNLHYSLHWLLAALTMYALARAMGMRRESAGLAGLTYAGSGWMLSVMTFYNILTVVAWWPLVMAGVIRRDRRGLILGALACGLALLGGEPVTAALGLVPLAALAVATHGPWKGLSRVATVGAAGCVIAAPQWVATLRVVGFSFRGTHGVLASQASFYSLEPRRLLELVLPFPFGLPTHVGDRGLGASGMLDHLPFYYSLHFGAIALLLALAAVGRQRLLSVVAASGLALSWLGSTSGASLLELGGGLFRSPEKLLFWVALALPLLAAAGFETLRGGGGRGVATVCLLAGGASAIGAAVLAASGGQTPLARLVLAERGTTPAALAAQGGLWILGLVLLAALLAGVWLALKLGRPEVLVALQLASLAQLAPLWMTDDVARYDDVGWQAGITAGEGVAVARMGYPPWALDAPAPLLPFGEPTGRVRLEAEELSPAPGVRHGLLYPVAPDLDGMHHLFYNLLTVKIAEASWADRARWLEVLGTEYVTSPEPVVGTVLEPLRTLDRPAGRSYVYRPAQPAPFAWWADSVQVATSPSDAFEKVASSPPGSLPGVVPEPVAHRAGGRVETIAAQPDRITLRVGGGGGLIVVQRSFQALFRARAGELELPILPVNLCLIGVVVPAGEHEVTIDVDPAPELIAGIVAAVFALFLLITLGMEARTVPLRIDGRPQL